MYGQRRRVLSQNFLYSRKLVDKLVRLSFLGPNDTVLEIGTGKGIITEKLLTTVNQVIGVEVDTELYTSLKRKFYHQRKKLHLINKDFLQYRLPLIRYKVFANIPFSIEGKIIRKLLDAPVPPVDCYLVMRQDLSERLSGYRKESQFSIFYKPWFDFDIFYRFRKTDYEPAARMDTVLLRFHTRKTYLLPVEEKKKYHIFVGQGFGGGKRLKFNLRSYFTHEQFRRAVQACSIGLKVKPSDLTVQQWVDLFKYARKMGKI